MASEQQDLVDSADLPRSRSEAKLLGYRHYFTGKPCKRGHVDKRSTGGGACAQCVRDRQKFRLENDPEYRNLHRRQTLAYKHRVLADPERRAQINKCASELRTLSESRREREREADAKRNARDDVKARRRELQKIRYHEVLKNSEEYKTKQRESQRRIVENHRAKYNAKTAARRAARKQATPNWLTSLMLENIVKVYEAAQRKSQKSGINYEVDHIAPLNGKLVCGLHVPWNLQVLSEKANRAKWNKFGLENTSLLF